MRDRISLAPKEKDTCFPTQKSRWGDDRGCRSPIPSGGDGLCEPSCEVLQLIRRSQQEPWGGEGALDGFTPGWGGHALENIVVPVASVSSPGPCSSIFRRLRIFEGSLEENFPLGHEAVLPGCPLPLAHPEPRTQRLVFPRSLYRVKTSQK